MEQETIDILLSILSPLIAIFLIVAVIVLAIKFAGWIFKNLGYIIAILIILALISS